MWGKPTLALSHTLGLGVHDLNVWEVLAYCTVQPENVVLNMVIDQYSQSFKSKFELLLILSAS